MKRNLICLLLVLILALGTACPFTSALAEAQPVTLTMWSWNSTLQDNVFAKYMELNPHVTIEMVPVQYSEFLQKLQIAVASDSTLPDIGYFGSYFRGKAFALDVWENLEAEPYNLDRSTLVDYSINSMINPRGEVVGVAESLSPGALAYKRDLAKQYFGTDDPLELEKLLPTWDALIEKGQQIQQESDGKVFCFTSLGQLQTILIGQNAVDFIDGDKIDVTKRFRPVVDMFARVRDAGIVDQIVPGSPAEGAAYPGSEHIFWYCANWSREFVIKPNNPDGAGNWGLMTPPGGCVDDGGSGLAISKKCQNKEAAWDVLQWYMSRDGAQVLKDTMGMCPNLKEYVDDTELVSYVDPYFAGQDTGKFFYHDAIGSIHTIQISSYDMVMSDALGLVMNSLVGDPALTADSAFEKMLEEIRMKLPDQEIL